MQYMGDRKRQSKQLQEGLDGEGAGVQTSVVS